MPGGRCKPAALRDNSMNAAKRKAAEERAEAEAYAEIERAAELRRDMELRHTALSIAVNKCANPGDVEALLDYSDAVYAWLSGATVN